MEGENVYNTEKYKASIIMNLKKPLYRTITQINDMQI